MTDNNTLTQMTVRLLASVHRALTERARASGQELADFVANVLARDCMQAACRSSELASGGALFEVAEKRARQ